MLWLLCAAAVSTTGQAGESVTWELNGNKLLFKGSGYIQDTSDEEYMYGWSSYKSSVTEVEIQKGVENVPSYAFYEFSELASVKLAESVYCINECAFALCEKLATVNFPKELQGIDRYAFYGCSALKSITVPSAGWIEYGAFSGSGLETVVIGNGVYGMQEACFASCSQLTEVTISNSVTELGAYVFYECTSLEKVTLPSNINVLQECLFYMCEKLQSVTIPSGVAAIMDECFYGCTTLTAVSIPENVLYIGSYSFSSCSSLTGHIVLDSVVSIGREAFCMTGITEITMKNADYIHSDAFYSCDDLQVINYGKATDPGAYIYLSPSPTVNVPTNYVGSTWCGLEVTHTNDIPNAELKWQCVIYDYDYYLRLTTYAIDSGTLSVSYRRVTLLEGYGDGESVIGMYYWSSNFPWKQFSSEITSVVIGDGISSVMTRFCENVYSLTSVTFGRDVEYIDDYAFTYTGIQKLVIPNSVRYIDPYAFQHCSQLTEVELGSSVEELDIMCFASATSLNKVTFHGMYEPYVDSDAFSGVDVSSVSVFVPELYTSDVFGPFTNIKKELTETTFEGRCNYDLSYVVDLSAGITSGKLVIKALENREGIIADYYYYGKEVPWKKYSSMITEIVIEEGVTEIQSNAFVDYPLLVSVTIPGTVSSIYSYAFQNCPLLTDVKYLGEEGCYDANAEFYECPLLESVQVYTTYDGDSFYGYPVKKVITPPAPATEREPPKSNTGLIVGLSVAGAAVVAAVTCVIVWFKVPSSFPCLRNGRVQNAPEP